MADRPADAAVPPVTVILLPGASLVDIHRLAAGLVLIRCPSCRAAQIVSTTTPTTSFVHADDDCPILRRIEAALVRLWAALAAETN